MSTDELLASFWVPGEPRAEARPRSVAMPNGKVRVYSSGNTKDWRAAIVAASRAMRPEAPLDGGLAVQLTFFFRRPRRLLAARHAEGPLPCVRKPDLDNLAKPVLDVLTTEGWWRDDAQVAVLSCGKLYCARGGIAGMRVRVWRMRDGQEP